MSFESAKENQLLLRKIPKIDSPFNRLISGGDHNKLRAVS